MAEKLKIPEHLKKKIQEVRAKPDKGGPPEGGSTPKAKAPKAAPKPVRGPGMMKGASSKSLAEKAKAHRQASRTRVRHIKGMAAESAPKPAPKPKVTAKPASSRVARRAKVAVGRAGRAAKNVLVGAKQTTRVGNKPARAVARRAETQLARRVAKSGALRKAARATRLGGRALGRASLVLGAAQGAYDTGRLGKQVYEAHKGISHAKKTAKAAAKHGVKVTIKRDTIPGAIAKSIGHALAPSLIKEPKFEVNVSSSKKPRKK